MSIDAINLTITSYMAVATVAPTLLGDAVDVLGRRPACVFSLSLYVVTNLATALSRSYVTVLVLRLFQAFAISGELETQVPASYRCLIRSYSYVRPASS